MPTEGVKRASFGYVATVEEGLTGKESLAEKSAYFISSVGGRVVLVVLEGEVMPAKMGCILCGMTAQAKIAIAMAFGGFSTAGCDDYL